MTTEWIISLLCIYVTMRQTMGKSLEDIVPHVNGFIRLGFIPPAIEMQRARLGEGAINITIDEEAQVGASVYLHP